MTSEVEKIREIRKKYEKLWLQINGVVAVGTGKTSRGGLGIIVSVKKKEPHILQAIPNEVEKVPIEIQETGEIKAL